MASRNNPVVKRRRSASHETPSTAAKPLRPAPQEQERSPRSVVEATRSPAADDAGSGHEDDSDGDEWVEVDEGYVEVDEADAFDRDENTPEPSLGQNQDDGEVEVNVNQRTKKRGKRKKEGVVVAKVKERRTRVKRAECWQHFKEVKAVSKKYPGKIGTKAKCLHCCKLFAYTPGGSTTSLNRHKDSCSIYLNKKGRQLRQGTIHLDPEKPGASLIVNHEYDHAEVLKIIAKMIIVHEYSFRMVEHAWFNILMKYMNASYKFISRKKIRAECMKVYLSEKEILKKQLKSIDNISLTCDLWTSNQNLCYLAVAAHYIDDNWEMQCRVLNFIELDPPHTGVVIAQAVFECFQEWKIEDKIMTITMDNASSNDVAAQKLMDKFVARKSAKFIPKYFHVRCCAHIVNLIVNDGIDPLQTLIGKLRDTVKYFKRSPLRMGKLLGVCKSLNIEVGKELCLDVSTRWSSTYRMVDTCTLYKVALGEYAQTDPTYKWQPGDDDWTLYGNIQPILKSFAEVTTVLSGSKYPTANIFYPYIMNVKIAINNHAAKKDDENLKAMGQAMLEKFDKYWDSTYAENSNGNIVKEKRKVKNNVMVIATILDPRFKMKLVEYCFKALYGREKGMSEAEDIKTEFFELYATYEMENRHNEEANNNEHISVSTRHTTSSMSTLSSGFQSFLEETNSEPCKSELTSYLEDKTHPIQDPNFTLLDWWRLNAHRYPIIAKMAKKFLNVPATSVSSESTFSTGGRVLDDYRSSLHPKMVEALVCASSFIKGSKENRVTPTIILEDDNDEDVEFIPFPESSLESN